LKEEIFGGKGNKLEMMKRFCVFADAPREVLNYIYKGARRPQIINFPLFPFNYVMRASEREAPAIRTSDEGLATCALPLRHYRYGYISNNTCI